MLGLVLSATNDRAKGPHKGPKGHPSLCRSWKDGRVAPRSSSYLNRLTKSRITSEPYDLQKSYIPFWKPKTMFSKNKNNVLLGTFYFYVYSNFPKWHYFDIIFYPACILFNFTYISINQIKVVEYEFSSSSYY